MESLVTFTDKEVLTTLAPSSWVEVTSPGQQNLPQQTPHHSHSHIHSHNTWAYPGGSLLAAHGGDPPATTERRDEPTTPSWEVMMQLPEHKSSCPQPGFVEIVRSLWGGECSPQIDIGVPAGEDEESCKAVGSSVMATWLFWHPTLGEMFIDMVTCILSVVDLGVDSMAEVCLVLALLEHSDSD